MNAGFTTIDYIIFSGLVFAILAAITLIAGLIWGTKLFGCSLQHLGFHSIFMMTFLAVIMFTNARSEVMDAKSYDVDPTLFETDKKFLLGSMGIVVIIVALYAYFW